MLFGQAKAAEMRVAWTPRMVREAVRQEALRQVEAATYNIALMIGMGVMSGENLTGIRERLITSYTEMQRAAVAEDTRLTLRPGEWALADAINALDRVIDNP